MRQSYGFERFLNFLNLLQIHSFKFYIISKICTKILFNNESTRIWEYMCDGYLLVMRFRRRISKLPSPFHLPEKYLHFDNAYSFQTRSVVFSTTQKTNAPLKKKKTAESMCAFAGRTKKNVSGTTMTSNVLEQIWSLRSLRRTSTAPIG